MAATRLCVVALLLCIYTDACLSYLNETNITECAKASKKITHFSRMLMENDDYLEKSLKLLSDYGVQIVDVIKSTPGQNDKWLWQHNLFANTVSDAFCLKGGCIEYAVGDKKSKLKKVFGAIKIVEENVNDYLREHIKESVESLIDKKISQPNKIVDLIETNINIIKFAAVHDKKPSNQNSLSLMPNSLFLNHIGKSTELFHQYFIRSKSVGLKWKIAILQIQLNKAYKDAVDAWITDMYYELLKYHRQVVLIPILTMLSYFYIHVNLFLNRFAFVYKRLWNAFNELFYDFLTFFALEHLPQLKKLYTDSKNYYFFNKRKLPKTVLGELKNCVWKTKFLINNQGVRLVVVDTKQIIDDISSIQLCDLELKIERNLENALNYFSTLKIILNHVDFNIVNNCFGSTIPVEHLNVSSWF